MVWRVLCFGFGLQGNSQAEAENGAPVVSWIEGRISDDLDTWRERDSLGELKKLEKFEGILVAEIRSVDGRVGRFQFNPTPSTQCPGFEV